MFTRGGKQYNSQLVTLSYRGCLYGGRPALLAGLGLVRIHLAYMGKPTPPILSGSLSRDTCADKIYFPTKPRIRYLGPSLITYT